MLNHFKHSEVFSTVLVSLSLMFAVRIQKNTCFYKKAIIMGFICVELYIVTESNVIWHSEPRLPGHLQSYYHQRMQNNQKAIFQKFITCRTN